MYDTITFLTDFGLRDDFVGVCRGVMRRIAPAATVIDVTHGIAQHDVARGALVQARSLPYLPHGIHLAVVDPGVGGERRGVAIRTEDGRVFVGPDNGLLTLAADTCVIVACRCLTNAHYHLDRVSRTFHARDVFAPVAAHLAAGAHFDDLGPPVDAASLVRLDLPVARCVEGEIHATVVDVDRFGNLELDVTSRQIAEIGLAPPEPVELWFALNPYYAVVAGTYADARRGELILYEDSYGAWAIAISGGNAASLTEAHTGDGVRIRPLRHP